MDKDLLRQIKREMSRKSKPPEDYAGAFLVLVVGVILAGWALQDPESLLKVLVLIAAQAHF